MLATCNLCSGEGKKEPFSVPWDPIGQELMKAHLEDVHEYVSPR